MKTVIPLMVRRRTQETITLVAMKMTTKVSRTRNLRKMPKSSKIRRTIRNLVRITKRLPRISRKSIHHLRVMYMIPIYRGSS